MTTRKRTLPSPNGVAEKPEAPHLLHVSDLQLGLLSDLLSQAIGWPTAESQVAAGQLRQQVEQVGLVAGVLERKPVSQ